MVTMVGTQDNIEDLVTSLLNLEHDAIEAYKETIERLDDQSLAQQVREFLQDHERHVRELSGVARDLGVEIPEGTAKSMLTKGKVFIADMIGDSSILMAMKTNEEDTVTAYDRASKQECCTPQMRQICERALMDEKRHREWFASMAKNYKDAA